MGKDDTTAGRLIVFEGVDGAGTTTQSRRLQDHLLQRGVSAHGTAQPSAGPIGQLIRRILAGQEMMTGSKPPGFDTMALLFAADRQDQQTREILPALQQGVHVICDRYVYSSVLYQSVSSGDLSTQPWIRELNRHIRRPDLVLLLRIDPDTAAMRRQHRGGAEEIFDHSDFQQKLTAQYDRLPELFPQDPIRVLDAGLEMDILGQQVRDAVRLLPGMENAE